MSPTSLQGAWKMVGVLTFFGTLAAIDKHFLTLVVPNIKADFGVSDVQIGLLIGLAFAVSNVAVSLPAGWLADRADRRRILAGGVLLWSIMAATCGLARSFGQLFVARVGVGLGEGVSPPASYSLIRDGVAPKRRGLAFAIFSLGGAVGSGMAFLIGGLLIAAIKAVDLSHVPVLGGMPSWQVALVVIGLAGLPLALLAFTFPDPGRTGAQVERATVGQILVVAGRHRAVLVPLLIFSVVQSALTSGFSAWIPSLLARTYHVGPESFGPTLGIVLMIGAPLGLVGAGLLIDRLGKEGPAIAAIISTLMVIIAGSLGPHASSITAYWPFQVVIIMASTVYLPVTSTLVARVMPSAAIGMTMAFLLFLQGIIGAGLGPLAVALLTEHVVSSAEHPINAAITIASLVLGSMSLVAAVTMMIASRRMEEALHDH